MTDLRDSVAAFLAQRRIAVVGVSRTPDAPANHVLRKLRGAGHDVFAVNPAAREVEGETSYPDLASIPEGVDAVVFAAPPGAAEAVVRECATLGIRHLWMHRSFGPGSLDPGAAELARELGLHVIAGACPMMFCEPVDVAHRCMRWILRWTGGLPRPAPPA